MEKNQTIEFIKNEVKNVLNANNLPQYEYDVYNSEFAPVTMITTNDIETTVNNDMLMYIDDNDIIYQYETWEPMTMQELDDAKSQFALILNISDRSEEAIEKHMQLNGFDGFADVYTW